MKTLITAVLIAVTLGMTQAELRHTQRNYIMRRQEAAQILPTSLTLPLSWQIGFARKEPLSSSGADVDAAPKGRRVGVKVGEGS
jgi:hypothetical protein